MKRTLRERINGLLVGDRTYPIILVIVVQLIGVDKIEKPVRVLERLDAASLKGVPDGAYTLHYNFDGQPYEKKVRVFGGRLLFGH